MASVQYRALAEKASDAFYRLSNTREQIQSYVFDGKVPVCCEHSCIRCICSSYSSDYLLYVLPLLFNANRTFFLAVIRASVPKMNLDDAFEQKNEIAKAVEDELEKVCVQ